MRERKRMLRLLIEDITLRRDGAIQIQIRWKGGATTTLERPLPLAAYDLRRTPAAIVEMIRALATEQTDRQVADTLNGRGLRSGTGQPFHRLRDPAHPQSATGSRAWPSISGTPGGSTAPEIAVQLGVHQATAKRFAREGVLRAQRADDA